MDARMDINPNLTGFGRRAAGEVGKSPGVWQDADLVLASPLHRAIETALGVFPDKDIVLAPYVAENHTPDLRLSASDVAARVRRRYGEAAARRIRTTAQYTDSNLPPEMFQSNFGNFIQWLLLTVRVLPERVAVVSHADYMLYILSMLSAQHIPGAAEATRVLRSNPQLGWTNMFAVSIVVQPALNPPMKVTLQSEGIISEGTCDDTLADVTSCDPDWEQRYG
jgi:broad specificity phosphatase PhoE